MFHRHASPRRARGAILAITAIILVVIVGIAALALDIGRIMVQRSEMQNAADAAALAGAAELNGSDGSLARAMAAARNLLTHEGHHARVAELLGGAMPTQADDAMQADSVPFRFYCSISSPFDADNDNECAGDPVTEDGVEKILATGDEDAHYIRVTLQPSEETDAYRVSLFFLPLLSPKSEQGVFATAVAGRHFSICNYPPVMICDPFEGGAAISGVNDMRQAVKQGYVNPGDMMVLKYQGPDASWAPGNFAFLSPGVPGDYATGARAVGEYLANPCQQPCTPPIVKTKPGSVESWPVWGINTYFEVYTHNSLKPDDYPPAPNIIEYPEDTGYKSWDTGNRFGDGNWDWQGYRDLYHRNVIPGSTGYVVDPGFGDLSGMSRWEVYNKEIETGYLPLDQDLNGPDDLPGTDDDLSETLRDQANAEEGTGTVCVRPECVPQPPVYTDPWTCESKGRNLPGKQVDCEDVEPAGSGTYPYNYFPDGRPEAADLYFDGTEPKSCEAIRAGEPPSTPNSIPIRRRLYVAVILCNAQNVHGGSNPVVRTFAEYFVLQRARIDKIDNRKLDVVTEFMGLVEETSPEYHVDIQLYE